MRSIVITTNAKVFPTKLLLNEAQPAKVSNDSVGFLAIVKHKMFMSPCINPNCDNIPKTCFTSFCNNSPAAAS